MRGYTTIIFFYQTEFLNRQAKKWIHHIKYMLLQRRRWLQFSSNTYFTNFENKWSFEAYINDYFFVSWSLWSWEFIGVENAFFEKIMPAKRKRISRIKLLKKKIYPRKWKNCSAINETSKRSKKQMLLY